MTAFRVHYERRSLSGVEIGGETVHAETPADARARFMLAHRGERLTITKIKRMKA